MPLFEVSKIFKGYLSWLSLTSLTSHLLLLLTVASDARVRPSMVLYYLPVIFAQTYKI